VTVRVLCVDDQAGRAGYEQQRLRAPLGGLLAPQGWLHLELSSGQIDARGTARNDMAHALSVIGLSEETAPAWNLVLMDVHFASGPLSPAGIPAGAPGDERFGLAVARRARELSPDLPVVLLSSLRHAELGAVEFPYVSKEALDAHGMRRVLLQHGRLTPAQRREVLAPGVGCVVAAPGTLDVYRDAFLNANTRLPILILGASGTGKELLARYVHRESGRVGRFVAVNVSAVPRELLEAELFGIEKRTATGVAGRRGLFAEAHEGTIFLDEIGDLAPEVQAKLLRVLQDSRVTPVGGRTAESLDLRLITATSRDIPSMVRAGAFRTDLYYRINTLTLELPPLAQRREELPELIRLFAGRAQAQTGKTGIEISDPAIAELTKGEFPGNIRELEGLVRRLVSEAGHHQVIGADVVRSLLGRGRLRTRTAPREHASASARPATAGGDGTGLGAVLAVMERAHALPEDPLLAGFKPQLEKAVRALLRDAASAALQRCRDPVSDKLNRQRAMQLLTGDGELKGRGPPRIINEILARPLNAKVTEEDLERVVEEWQDRKARGRNGNTEDP